MEITLLLRLLIAHLLTDFIFQPKNWVRDKTVNRIKSKKLFLHIVVTTAVAYLFSGYYTSWIIPLIIFITHYGIDLAKSYLKERFSYFIIDQFLHLLVIVILWLSVEGQWHELKLGISRISLQKEFWLITAAYLFVTWPLGIVIGKATQQWRNQIAKEQERIQLDKLYKARMEGITGEREPVKIAQEEQGLGLDSAGKWIGICERVLILSFILMQQYTAIGFLMTAKSILRFSEKESNTQLKTEYILVGTLVSFTCAALLGLLVNHII